MTTRVEQYQGDKISAVTRLENASRWFPLATAPSGGVVIGDTPQGMDYVTVGAAWALSEVTAQHLFPKRAEGIRDSRTFVSIPIHPYNPNRVVAIFEHGD